MKENVSPGVHYPLRMGQLFTLQHNGNPKQTATTVLGVGLGTVSIWIPSKRVGQPQGVLLPLHAYQCFYQHERIW